MKYLHSLKELVVILAQPIRPRRPSTGLACGSSGIHGGSKDEPTPCRYSPTRSLLVRRDHSETAGQTITRRSAATRQPNRDPARPTGHGVDNQVPRRLVRAARRRPASRRESRSRSVWNNKLPFGRLPFRHRPLRQLRSVSDQSTESVTSPPSCANPRPQVCAQCCHSPRLP